MTALYRFQMAGIFNAKAPIIHTEETIGNVARIKRIKVLDAGRPVFAPALSGNSFRGQLRDLIGDHFIEMMRKEDDRVTMSHLMYGVIFSGGVMQERLGALGTAMEELARTIPMLRLLGSAFGNRMMPSKISVSHSKLSRYEDAIKAFDEAIKTNPQYAGAWNNKGIALEALGRSTDAQEAYVKARELGFTG